MYPSGIVNIIIDERDSYFTNGLKLCLNAFFCKNKQGVNFSPSEKVDLLIRSESALPLKKAGKEIIISEKKYKATIVQPVCSCKNILFKNDTIETFTLLLKKTMMGKASKKLCLVCRAKLTRREKQVLNKFSVGLNPLEIARDIGLDVKSVSQHKRNAMRKLSLQNNKELLIWLTINKVNANI